MVLFILRAVQGLSIGGEHTGSAIFIAEHAPPQHRTLWVSSVPISAALGILTSSAAALLLVTFFNEDQLYSWGWRVGFAVGALLCFVSVLLRLGMPESPYDQQIKKEINHKSSPILDLIRDKETFKNLLITFSLASSWGIFYQTFFIWMPTFLTKVIHFTENNALQVNSFYLLIFAALLVIVGYFADRYDRRSLLHLAELAR